VPIFILLHLIYVKALSIYCNQVALLVEYSNGLRVTELVIESHGR
jgi:hypothetical protein